MEIQRQRRIKNGFWISIFWICLPLIAGLRVLALYPEHVETYFARGFYPIWFDLATRAAGSIPFSLFECLIGLVVLVTGFWLIRAIVLVIRRKVGFLRAAWCLAMRFLSVAAILYLWFLVSWGMNYHRVSLADKAGFNEIEAAREEYLTTARWAASRINALSRPVTMEEAREAMDQTLSSLDEAMEHAGEEVIETYPAVKNFYFNKALDATGTHGIFSPFTMEVHLSRTLFPEELPFLAAHETAHAKGYTSETEANLLAFESCMASGNPLARFSAFYHVLGYLSQALPAEERARLYRERRQEVRDLDKRIKERNDLHAGIIQDVSWKTYNYYLKMNAVKEGVKSYSRVGNWIAYLYFEEARQALAGGR